MLFHPNYAVFDRVLPASAYQQQADMPWWVWLLIIVVVIFLFVLLWRRFGLAKGGEQPKPAVEAKPMAPFASRKEEPTLVEKKPQPQPIAVEESTLIAKKPKPEVVPGTPDKPDDLSIIEGIGPKIASVLQGVGIKTFAQLAHTNVAILEDTLKTASIRLADPASWPEQAKLASEGKMDELKALQDTLKGGRRA